MYKLRRVYICNHCGAVALPRVLCVGMDIVRTMPSGWSTRDGSFHLCPDCYRAYQALREQIPMKKHNPRPE